MYAWTNLWANKIHQTWTMHGWWKAYKPIRFTPTPKQYSNFHLLLIQEYPLRGKLQTFWNTCRLFRPPGIIAQQQQQQVLNPFCRVQTTTFPSRFLISSLSSTYSTCSCISSHKTNQTKQNQSGNAGTKEIIEESSNMCRCTKSNRESMKRKGRRRKEAGRQAMKTNLWLLLLCSSGGSNSVLSSDCEWDEFGRFWGGEGRGEPTGKANNNNTPANKYVCIYTRKPSGLSCKHQWKAKRSVLKHVSLVRLLQVKTTQKSPTPLALSGAWLCMSVRTCTGARIGWISRWSSQRRQFVVGIATRRRRSSSFVFFDSFFLATTHRSIKVGNKNKGNWWDGQWGRRSRANDCRGREGRDGGSQQAGRQTDGHRRGELLLMCSSDKVTEELSVSPKLEG
jgi:hypothetical protein